MAVFKEEVRMLEKLMQKQHQIWPDSCDIGIEATSEIKAILRHVLKTLLLLPGSKLVWKSGNNSQYEWNLRVYWSFSEYTDINVLYYKGREKELFSLNMQAKEEVSFTFNGQRIVCNNKLTVN